MLANTIAIRAHFPAPARDRARARARMTAPV